MSGPLRSKQGCWTCRLRKKKCDEQRARCALCESLCLPCYGYGPKPDWMKNGETEREMADSLKQIVKHTSRHKPASPAVKRRRPVVQIAPKPTDGAGGAASSSTSESNDPSLHDPSLDNPMLVASISADESVLLMHFLDNVFTLQYPTYRPEISEGGRGWLLALLLQTKPLYHAALALSAYHRRTILTANSGSPCPAAAIVQQETHLKKSLAYCREAMEAVNQFVQADCGSHGLGIMSSIVQLVFFELFAGQDNVWQIHLRAATALYDQSFKDNFAAIGLALMSREIISENRSLIDYGIEIGQEVAQEVVTFRFISSTVTWLDIISSIATGTTPHLLSHHSGVLAADSQTNLVKIMGCQNWAMLQIGRISALHERKIHALQQQHLDCTEFQEIVNDIDRELTRRALQDFNIAENTLCTMLHPPLDPPLLITHVFAYTASIYLHLVVHGFSRLDLLDTIIAAAMRFLQTMTQPHLLPAMICPLYIIGCVARHHDEQNYFRAVFSSPPVLEPLFEHRKRILPILEEVWRRRRLTSTEFVWRDAVELTQDILLV